jgi:hypothetical protein
MFTCHMVVLPAATSSIYLSSSLIQVPLQLRLVEFVITLQYVYPKPFTHYLAVTFQARNEVRMCDVLF